MAAKFEISKDHAGKFRFHLKAPNGEIIAASQGYDTKTRVNAVRCSGGINAVVQLWWSRATVNVKNSRSQAASGPRGGEHTSRARRFGEHT